MKYFAFSCLLLIILTQSTNLRWLQTSCSSDSDCSSGKRCNIGSGACVDCLSNSDCSGNLQCVSPQGVCGRNCTLHSDCDQNEHCFYQSSPYHCTPNHCGHDGDCPNSTCSNSLCVIPQVNQPSQPSSNGTCTTDADCSSGLQCITSEGICGHACQSHQDCTALNTNTQCDYHTTPYSCIANPCTHDGDCPGSTCSNGFCAVEGIEPQPECTTNADCPQGKLCQVANNTCVDPCTSDVECGWASYCMGICYPFAEGQCALYEHCKQGEICYKRAHARFGRCALQCSSHQDCRTNEICDFNADLFSQCVAKECVHSNDCEGTSNCVSGRCEL